jgi:transcriptional regulator with XRE-family HTH domain
VSLAKRFSANLIRARKGARLNQTELAALASVSRSYANRLEQGVRVPSMDTIIRLAGALRIDPSDLMAGMRWEAHRGNPGYFVACWRGEREPKANKPR